MPTPNHYSFFYLYRSVFHVYRFLKLIFGDRSSGKEKHQGERRTWIGCFLYMPRVDQARNLGTACVLTRNQTFSDVTTEPPTHGSSSSLCVRANPRFCSCILKCAWTKILYILLTQILPYKTYKKEKLV